MSPQTEQLAPRDEPRRTLMASRVWCSALVLFALMSPGRVWAQSSPASAPQQTLTLEQAIQYAVEHYPTVRAAAEQIAAAIEGVTVARAANLPRLDAVWQSNRATANNIFGQVLPQPVLPALSGPVLPSASSETIWSSAAGALFTWEPFDFGLRNATEAGADAAVARARANQALTQLEVQRAVGLAFLTLLANQQAVDAAQADVTRRDVLARIVHTLVDNQLRPGAEAARVDAERAAAQTRLIQAQAAVDQARITMARLLGVTDDSIVITGGRLLNQMPGSMDIDQPPSAHPLAAVHRVAVDFARTQERVLGRTDRPRVYLASSVFARGSGATTTGPFDTGLGGLGLQRANWAAGVQVMFPNVFDFSSLHARQRAAADAEHAEAALYDEAVLTITTQQQSAAALLLAARAVAANTPVQLAAATESETQARARYQAGLASLVEVADAQNLLAQAEYQDRLARVDVWRALLAQAASQGSLSGFLALLHTTTGAR